ncbi:hypothetical protein [Aliarcobacter cryaerophilus]|uniref:hypothetical protein n=1 Tax=Aliarcobacter cryaerophilus TaxID=28198 RepID=UPI0021B4162A|nr:hypothetical protein [Aliarcobacter cryaerophilus]MCT7527455.1 hypothetical protein [Aliarcobacter cryaerophilus]
MRNLQFKQLLLISDTRKLGNQFKFEKGYNLITADDNSVGKSTLAKLLLWTFGCEPDFDTTWKSNDCKTMVKFSIEEDEISILRYGSIIYWKENKSELIKFSSIGDFAEHFANKVNFKVLLPSRDEEKGLEVPTPAYYFLPFYIDQKKSWSNAWDSFNSLQQFANWKQTVIKYHTGYLTPKFFELELVSQDKKNSISTLNSEIEKMGYALDIVKEHTSKASMTIDEKEFEKMSKEVEIDLLNLSKQQEKVMDELSILTVDQTYLEHQKNIAEHLIKELDADYVFSVENLEEEEIECPLCGTNHDNSIVNRSSILSDKENAKDQLIEINNKLIKLNQMIAKQKEELKQVKSKINEINAKYTIDEDSDSIPLNKIVEVFAYKSISDNIGNSKKEKLSEINDYKNDQKEIKKEQRQLLSKEDKQTLDDTFMDLLTSYVKLLDAEGVNLSSIKSPLDYNKIIKEGGAAENTRGVLAYYLSVFSMISNHDNEVIAPLVIDTPNQQEQSDKNYENIVSLISKKILSTDQIVLCAMENEKLKPFKDKANIIKLDKNKLLDESKYDDTKKIFDEIIDNCLDK